MKEHLDDMELGEYLKCMQGASRSWGQKNRWKVKNKAPPRNRLLKRLERGSRVWIAQPREHGIKQHAQEVKMRVWDNN